MRLFHRHKWRVETQELVTISRRASHHYDWHDSDEVARIDKCECGKVRGWLISADCYRRAPVPWLREVIKVGETG